MELIPYDEFARLRNKDFWPPGTKIWEDETGCSCCIGYGDGECTRSTFFLWPPERPGEVAEIGIQDIAPDFCPPEVAQRIFDRLRLPLRPAMSVEEAIQALGQPMYHKKREHSDLLRFLVGERWPYRIVCNFYHGYGLSMVAVVRNEFFRET